MLRKIIPVFVLSILLIRFLIEIVLTTVFKNSAIVNSINNNQIGFHHYQLGVLIVLVAILIGKLMPKWHTFVGLALGLGLALFLDQYTYLLQLFGINLPYDYRSGIDYIVIALVVTLTGLYWILLKEQRSS